MFSLAVSRLVAQSLRTTVPKCANIPMVSSFHTSKFVRGFDEFYDQSEKNEVLVTGRGWTAADLRRKSFDDLHKLWYVLYKERNLLLTSRAKARRNTNPLPIDEENRYTKVKRSMAAIKLVLDERKKIDEFLKFEELIKNAEETKPAL